jgi:hypothetical protein
MRKLTLLLALFCAVHAFAEEDTPQNRQQEADRYVEASPPAELFASMTTQIAKNVPAAQRQGFIDTMSRNLDVAALTSAMKAAMVKDFTADEIKALADFYGSPIAKSAMKKFGTYMADVMPAVQSEVMKAVTKTTKEQAAKASTPADSAPSAAASPAHEQ